MNTTSNGGITPIAAATATLSTTVVAVADTPSVTGASTNEDTQSASGLVITRNAVDGVEVTHFKITGISNGTLFRNDGTTQIANGDFITVAQGGAGLKFTPASNFNGSGGFTVQASTSNGDAGLGGSTVNATVTVTPVNDAPVLDASGTMTLTTITEDQTTNSGDAVGSIVLSAGGDRITDVDSVFAFEGFAVTGLASGNGSWEYTVNGINWFAVGSVSDSAALLLRDTDRLRFVPDGQNSTSGTVTFRAWDQTSGSAGTKADVSVNGGTTAFSTATETATITVTPINDAPSASNLNAGETFTEDTALNLVDIVAADVDDASVTATLTVSNVAAGSLNTATSGAVTSTYVPATGVWTAAGAIANVNVLLAGLTFTPAVNFNGSFTIATSVSDGAASVSGSKAISGVAVNDAPSLGNGVLAAVVEDTVSPAGELLGTVFAGQFADVDAGSSFAGIAVVGNTASAATQGVWQYSSNAGGNWFAVGAVADGAGGAGAGRSRRSSGLCRSRTTTAARRPWSCVASTTPMGAASRRPRAARRGSP